MSPVHNNICGATSTSNRLQLCVYLALYLACLQWFYIVGVVPIWEYAGLTFNSPSPKDWVAMSILALVPSIWLPCRLTRPSQMLVLYLVLAVYMPTTFVLLFRASDAGAKQIYPLIVVLLLAVGVLTSTGRWKIRPLRRMPVSRQNYWVCVWVLLVSCYVIVFWAYRGQVHWSNLLSSDVVEQRLLSRDVLASSPIPKLVGYSIIWPAYALNPLFMVYGLFRFRRRYGYFIVGAGGQLFLYTFGAMRGILVTIPFVCLAYWFVTGKWHQHIRPVVIGFVALLVVSTLPVYMGQRTLAIVTTSITSRALISPAYVTGLYYAFFSEQPKTNFSQVTGLGWIGGNSYSGKSLGTVIGESLDQPGNNANANMWAEGYASFGFTGIIICTIIAAMALRLFDLIGLSVGNEFSICLISVHAWSFGDVGIFTSLLGQGFLFTIVLLYFFPADMSVRCDQGRRSQFAVRGMEATADTGGRAVAEAGQESQIPG